MSLITIVGDQPVPIPASVLRYADTIKLQNYRVNSPRKFAIESLPADGGFELMKSLSGVIGIPAEQLDFVYFSVCQGAEEHTDALSPTTFKDDTYVIPVVLPKGLSQIHARDGEQSQTVDVEFGRVYHFDHTKPHSMTLEDTESGCVVVMVAVKHN